MITTINIISVWWSICLLCDRTRTN